MYINDLSTTVQSFAKHRAQNAVNIMLLGLGGGALPFLLAQQCNNCKLTAVDLSTDAIQIARNLVQPDDSNRTTYVHAEGGRYVQRCRTGQYDMIILDAYDGDTLAAPFLTEQTTKHVYRALSKRGKYLTNVYVNKANSILPSFSKLVGGVFGTDHVSEHVSADGGNWQSVIVTADKTEL